MNKIKHLKYYNQNNQLVTKICQKSYKLLDLIVLKKYNLNPQALLKHQNNLNLDNHNLYKQNHNKKNQLINNLQI
jgi:hypothetical protein